MLLLKLQITLLSLLLLLLPQSLLLLFHLDLVTTLPILLLLFTTSLLEKKSITFLLDRSTLSFQLLLRLLEQLQRLVSDGSIVLQLFRRCLRSLLGLVLRLFPTTLAWCHCRRRDQRLGVVVWLLNRVTWRPSGNLPWELAMMTTLV